MRGRFWTRAARKMEGGSGGGVAVGWDARNGKVRVCEGTRKQRQEQGVTVLLVR